MKTIVITLVSVFLLFNFGLAQKNWEILFFDDFNRQDGEMGENYDVTLYPEGSVTISNNEAVVCAQKGDVSLPVHFSFIITPTSIFSYHIF